MAMKMDLPCRILTEADCDTVVKFVRRHFTPFEPLCVEAGVCGEEEKEFPDILIKNSLWQGVSIGAFDQNNGQLCGIRINMLAKNMDILPVEDNDSKYSNNMQSVYRALSSVKEGFEPSFFGNKYMDHVFVVVDQAYGRRGIASELYRQSEKLAREYGCDKMIATCTNFFTKRSTENAGYVVVKEIFYQDYVDKLTGKNPFSTIPDPHKSVSLLIKTLSTND